MTNIENQIIDEISKDSELGKDEISKIKKFVNFLIKNKPEINIDKKFKDKLKQDIDLMIKLEKYNNKKDGNLLKNIIYLVSGFGLCSIGVFILSQNGIINFENIQEENLEINLSEENINSDEMMSTKLMMLDTLSEDSIEETLDESNSTMEINNFTLRNGRTLNKESILEENEEIVINYPRNIIQNLGLKEINQNIYENDNFTLSINGEKFILILKNKKINSNDIKDYILVFLKENISDEITYQYDYGNIYYFSDGIRAEINEEKDQLLTIEKEF